MLAYATQMGPDGLGGERCGGACLASAMLSEGWDSDPYELMIQVSREHGFTGRGATSEQMIDAAEGYGFSARLWGPWPDAMGALEAGEAVMALLHNSYLVPRQYPEGAGWNAMHWIRLVRQVDGGELIYCYDPLTYLRQPGGLTYQGPNVYTAASIRAAIRNTSYPESGVVLTSPSGKSLNA